MGVRGRIRLARVVRIVLARVAFARVVFARLARVTRDVFNEHCSWSIEPERRARIRPMRTMRTMRTRTKRSVPARILKP